MNFRLGDKWYADVLTAVEEEKGDYGRDNWLGGKKYMVEFLSLIHILLYCVITVKRSADRRGAPAARTGKTGRGVRAVDERAAGIRCV